jgi:uncharacterized repeat protein (TIGR01451 family)
MTVYRHLLVAGLLGLIPVIAGLPARGAAQPPPPLPIGLANNSTAPPAPSGPAITVPRLTTEPPRQAPSVVVEVVGPETVPFGTPIAYSVVVRNTGTSAVAQVRAEQELAAGVRYVSSQPPAEMAGDKLSWSLGTLEAGGERRIQVQVQPGGEGDVPSTATVTFAAVCGLRTRITRPKLSVAMTAPPAVSVGEPVPFQIQLTNTGTGPATRLSVRDQLPEGLRHPQGSLIEADLGTLQPGETRSITLTTTAAKPGQQFNEMTALADGGVEASARATVKVVEPALQVRQTGPATGYLRGEIGFGVEVSNPGSAACKNVQVSETLPEGLEFVSASDAGQYTPATRTLTWTLAAQEPGAQRVLTFRAKAATAGDWAWAVAGRADHGVQAQADARIHLEGVPALTVEVVDLEDPIEVGGETTYEIRVINQGSCPCTGVQIQGTASDGLMVVSASGPVPNRVLGPQVVFEPFAKLATKADLIYRVRAKGTQPGDARFKVQMTCDQLRQPVAKEECTRVYKP